MAGDLGSRMAVFESLPREEKAKRLEALTPEQRTAFVAAFKQWKGAAQPAPPPAAAAPEQADDEPSALSPRSTSGTVLRGVGQGASLGFSDELAGATNALTALPASMLLKLAQTSFGRNVTRRLFPEFQALPDEVLDAALRDAYSKASSDVLGTSKAIDAAAPLAGARAAYVSNRDAARTENDTSRTENPKTFLASEIAGNLLVPGPKVAAGAKLPGVGLRLARGGAHAVTGALTGAITGAGHSNADLVDEPSAAEGGAGQFLKDVGGAAAGGAVINTALGTTMDKLTQPLRRAAENNALKAMGVRAGISNQLEQMGYDTADEGRQLGRVALDTGVIPVWGTAEKVARNATERKQLSGAMIDDALQQADHAPVDFDQMAWRAVGNVVGDGLSPTAARKGGEARRLVGDIVKLKDAAPSSKLLPELRTPTEPSVFDANKLKSDMYDGINYATDPSLATKMQRNVARGVKESIEQHVRDFAGEEAGDQLVTANKRWGQMNDIERLARDEATRQSGRTTPLTSTLMGVGAASALGGPAGAGAGVGTALITGYLRPRASALMAHVDDAAARHGGAAASLGTRAFADRLKSVKDYFSEDEER